MRDLVDNDSKIRIHSQGERTREQLKKQGVKEPEILGYYVPKTNSRISIGIPKNVKDLERWQRKMDVKYKSRIEL